jgi:hypothetical protein
MMVFEKVSFYVIPASAGARSEALALSILKNGGSPCQGFACCLTATGACQGPCVCGGMHTTYCRFRSRRGAGWQTDSEVYGAAPSIQYIAKWGCELTYAFFYLHNLFMRQSLFVTVIHVFNINGPYKFLKF